MLPLLVAISHCLRLAFVFHETLGYVLVVSDSGFGLTDFVDLYGRVSSGTDGTI